jgi:hypothetical protein
MTSSVSPTAAVESMPAISISDSTGDVTKIVVPVAEDCDHVKGTGSFSEQDQLTRLPVKKGTF